MSSPTDDDRDLVMHRIREALRIRRQGLPSPGDAERYRELLPVVGDDLEARIERFREWSERLRTEFIVCSRDELDARLAALRETHGWQRGACHSAALPSRALAAAGLKNDHALVIDDTGGATYEKTVLEVCDVAFSSCDALVAQTGSVLLTSRGAGGRALSVLPPHHVVLATAEQLVPDLPAAMALVRERHGEDLPSLVTLHTGPSRTGDIERTIVLGAHGPKKLTVILILP